jgi:hypothetical protein
MTIKNAVLWDVTQCGSRKNRRFGGTCRLKHQGDDMFFRNVFSYKSHTASHHGRRNSSFSLWDRRDLQVRIMLPLSAVWSTNGRNSQCAQRNKHTRKHKYACGTRRCPLGHNRRTILASASPLFCCILRHSQHTFPSYWCSVPTYML